MAQLIKDKQIVTDTWLTLELGENDTAESIALPAGDVVFPFAVWQARKDEILARGGKIGLLIKGEDLVEEVAADIAHFAVIAVNFPKFVDGRGYSTARLLRSRYGWMGELRAIGDVLHDQLFYMKRCGFDSFAFKAGKDIEGALAKGFNTWNESYPAAVDPKQPLFRRSAA